MTEALAPKPEFEERVFEVPEHWRLGPDASLADACTAVRRGAPVLLVEDASGACMGVADPLEVRVRWVRGEGRDDSIRDMVHAEEIEVASAPAQPVPSAPLGPVVEVQLLASTPGRRVDRVRVKTLVLGELDALLMAGGEGRRLRPLTEGTPKPLLPVQGVPIIEHLVRQFSAHGVARIFVSVLYLADRVRQFFGDGSRLGVAAECVAESEPLGTAGALGLLRGSARGPLVVANGDIMTRVDLGAMLAHHVASRADVTVGTVPYGWRIPYGVVHSDGLQLTRIEEKPLVRFETNAGIYIFNSERLDSLESGRAYDMVELLNEWAVGGRVVSRFPIVEAWSDVGRPADYERVQDDEDFRPS